MEAPPADQQSMESAKKQDRKETSQLPNSQLHRILKYSAADYSMVVIHMTCPSLRLDQDQQSK